MNSQVSFKSKEGNCQAPICSFGSFHFALSLFLFLFYLYFVFNTSTIVIPVNTSTEYICFQVSPITYSPSTTYDSNLPNHHHESTSLVPTTFPSFPISPSTSLPLSLTKILPPLPNKLHNLRVVIGPPSCEDVLFGQADPVVISHQIVEPTTHLSFSTLQL